MVYLSRIYTKSGDGGETSLGTGERISKTHPRIIAYGTIDELNSLLGVAVALGNLSDESTARLQSIQNDLFDLGADLCMPESGDPQAASRLRATPEQVTQLENWIDSENEKLQPLTSFILPGGTPAAAYLHLGRTVCRRAEIEVLSLAALEKINPQVPIYLNRLSDFLFVLARVENSCGAADVLWKPGGQSGESRPK
jgi:cob(I)alamin adenosyltransferase